MGYKRAMSYKRFKTETLQRMMNAAVQQTTQAQTIEDVFDLEDKIDDIRNELQRRLWGE